MRIRIGSAAVWFRLTGFATVSLLSACTADDAANPEDTPYYHLAAGTRVVEQTSFSTPREFAGLVVAAQSSDLGFELPGQLARIDVNEGAIVERGQALAVLDTRLLQAEQAELVAREDDLRARLALNTANLKRALELREQGFSAAQQIDELKAGETSLQAQLAHVAASMEGNRARIAKSTMLAPFAGAVARRFVDQGAVVAAGTPVLRVLQNRQLEARIGVPARLLAGLVLGATVPLTVAGQARSGTVLALGSDLTRSTLTVPVRVAIEDAAGLVVGEQISLHLDEVVTQPGLWVPITAMTEGLRGLWNVYVLNAPDAGLYRLEARDVRVLYADKAHAFVQGALNDGEIIVASGLHRLVPGQQVRLEERLVSGAYP